MRKGILGAAIAAASIALAGCAASEQPTTSTSASKKTDKSAKACGIKATDDCTPRVDMGHSVRVDALYWKVTGVDARSSIGDMKYGMGEKANGTFVVVNLNVRSDKDESATLTDDIVSIETSDGNVYKADSDGTIAAIGDGDDPLWFEDIGPDASVSSKVVFDLPSSALHKKLSVRFNELGFGSNHGYSALPTL